MFGQQLVWNPVDLSNQLFPLHVHFSLQFGEIVVDEFIRIVIDAREFTDQTLTEYWKSSVLKFWHVLYFKTTVFLK